MAPAKSRSGHGQGHDDRSDNAHNGTSRDKDATNGAQAHLPVNGGGGSKMRRVASTAGTNLRDPAPAGSSSTHEAPSKAASTSDSLSNENNGTASGAALQLSSFGRPFLHSYRRVHRLATPTSFVSDYHRWVLERPGSVGLQSPTMRRTKVFRRQSRDDLVGAVRKHFNSQAIQENDIVIDFLHKVGTTASIPASGVPKPTRTRKKE